MTNLLYLKRVDFATVAGKGCFLTKKQQAVTCCADNLLRKQNRLSGGFVHFPSFGVMTEV